MALSARRRVRRVGMPAPGSIREIKKFTPPGVGRAAAALAPRAAPAYRILRTREVDQYERPLSRIEAPSFGVARFARLGDAFAGKERKAAKLSISTATTRSFGDLRTLIDTLVAHKAMVERKPPIATSPQSKRVPEEDRNVRARVPLRREPGGGQRLSLDHRPHARRVAAVVHDRRGVRSASGR